MILNYEKTFNCKSQDILLRENIIIWPFNSDQCIHIRSIHRNPESKKIQIRGYWITKEGILSGFMHKLLDGGNDFWNYPRDIDRELHYYENKSVAVIDYRPDCHDSDIENVKRIYNEG